MKLWGGRFETGPSEVFERFSRSLHFDKRLLEVDIRGSQAFARALEYAEMVYNGLWFTPLREALDAFFEAVSEPTTGEIKLRLYKGNIEPLSRKSPNSLYSLDIASFTMGEAYDQKDALGFINLIGLPMKVRALAAKAK